MCCAADNKGRGWGAVGQRMDQRKRKIAYRIESGPENGTGIRTSFPRGRGGLD